MNNLINIDTLKPLLISHQLRKLPDTEQKHIEALITRFDSLCNYSLLVISDTLEIKKYLNTSYLIFLSKNFAEKEMRSPLNEVNITESELIGLALLQKDYGRILIRPETIADKISDLFLHTDIDFDFDKEFSNKYYLGSNDEAVARRSISPDFLKSIRQYNNLIIEIDGSVLMARLKKSFSIEDGEIITKFITEINNGQN